MNFNSDDSDIKTLGWLTATDVAFPGREHWAGRPFGGGFRSLAGVEDGRGVPHGSRW